MSAVRELYQDERHAGSQRRQPSASDPPPERDREHDEAPGLTDNCERRAS